MILDFQAHVPFVVVVVYICVYIRILMTNEWSTLKLMLPAHSRTETTMNKNIEGRLVKRRTIRWRTQFFVPW